MIRLHSHYSSLIGGSFHWNHRTVRGRGLAGAAVSGAPAEADAMHLSWTQIDFGVPMGLAILFLLWFLWNLWLEGR